MAIEATDAFVPHVMPVIELHGLVDGIELVGRIRSAREAKKEHGHSDGSRHAEPEARADDGVRPDGEKRGHPREPMR